MPTRFWELVIACFQGILDISSPFKSWIFRSVPVQILYYLLEGRYSGAQVAPFTSCLSRVLRIQPSKSHLPTDGVLYSAQGGPTTGPSHGPVEVHVPRDQQGHKDTDPRLSWGLEIHPSTCWRLWIFEVSTRKLKGCFQDKVGTARCCLSKNMNTLRSSSCRNPLAASCG